MDFPTNRAKETPPPTAGQIKPKTLDNMYTIRCFSEIMNDFIAPDTTHDVSFKKADRILKRDDFRRLYKNGKKIYTDCFIAERQSSRHNRSRLGLTVSKKVGGAVKRNRIKRLTREYFRLNRHRFSHLWDINIIAKKKAAKVSAHRVFRSLEEIVIQS